MKKVLLYGYGGHAKVLAELLLEDGATWVGVFDDKDIETSSDHIEYLGKYSPNIHPELKVIIAIGNNVVREKLAKEIKHPFFSFIHKSAFVSSSAKIHKGTVVLQNAIIQSNTIIGEHCIVNIQASVDHDTIINDFVHIAPHSYVGSNSTVNSRQNVHAGEIVPRFSVK